MTHNIIEVIDLHKKFENTQALSGVNLSVQQGSVLGLVGPNGCGKSTLIAHMCGVLHQDKGELRILGESVFENPSIKQRIACVSSEPYFIGSESLEGMADFYYRILPTFSVSRLKALAHNFDFDTKCPLRKLSRGTQAQAALWLALSIEADILLLDEAMDGIDPLARRRMWRLIMDAVTTRNLTVVACSHNLREFEGICDHLALMGKGKVRDTIDLDHPSSQLVRVQIVPTQDFPTQDFPAQGFPAQDFPSSQAFTIIRDDQEGRLHNLLVRGEREVIEQAFAQTQPSYLEILPLSLEERFICEFGGDDDVK